jgi:hypothetical protein
MGQSIQFIKMSDGQMKGVKANKATNNLFIHRPVIKIKGQWLEDRKSTYWVITTYKGKRIHMMKDSIKNVKLLSRALDAIVDFSQDNRALRRQEGFIKRTILELQNTLVMECKN